MLSCVMSMSCVAAEIALMSSSSAMLVAHLSICYMVDQAQSLLRLRCAWERERAEVSSGRLRMCPCYFCVQQ